MAKILIAGDFAPRARIAGLLEEERYADIFSEVIPITARADYSIVNLEAPVVENPLAIKISKCGGHLKCNAKAVKAIKYAGFDMVTLANNHLNDYGPEGVLDTLRVCHNEGIDTIGAGKDLKQASSIIYKEIKGLRFAFINCCEHEFSIATDSTPGSNPLNPISQFYSISQAKKNSDRVIVIVHGGHEHYQLPSPRMQEVYRFFVDAGADAVINHHQHCYSGYEMYNSRPIIYGIGNFCFDIIPTRVDTIWNKGYMVELEFGEQVTFKLYPYTQCGEIPSVKLLTNGAFDSDLTKLNKIISSHEMLARETENYYNSCIDSELSILEPYRGRVLMKLFHFGLLPKCIKKSKISSILNRVDCESHRDRMIYSLKKKIK